MFFFIVRRVEATMKKRNNGFSSLAVDGYNGNVLAAGQKWRSCANFGGLKLVKFGYKVYI